MHAELDRELIQKSAKITTETAKMTGIITKGILIKVLEAIRNKPEKMAVGKTNLDKILKSGQEIKMVDMSKEDIKKFNEEAKKYGIQFAVISEKNKELKTVLFKAIDMGRVERSLQNIVNKNLNPKEKRASIIQKLNDIRKGKQVEKAAYTNVIKLETMKERKGAR